jgi:hypothetical protein
MNKVRACMLLVVVSLVLCYGYAAYNKHRRQIRRGEAHQRGETYIRVKYVQSLIERAAGDEPDFFRRYVGTGVTAQANTLPDRFLFYLASRGLLLDAWGHPLHVSIHSTSTNRAVRQISYTIRVWSDGANGQEENHGGSDLTTSENITIETE